MLNYSLCTGVSLAVALQQAFILIVSFMFQSKARKKATPSFLPLKGSLVSMPVRTVHGPYLAISGSQGASTLSPGSMECFILFTYSRMSSSAVLCTHTGCLPCDICGLANSTRNVPLSLCYQEQNNSSSEKQSVMCQVI